MSNGSGRFFVVGCPRAGTTLVSVLLDRHSRLSVPPETAFYTEIAPRLGRNRDQLIAVLRSWRRLPELGLAAEDVAERVANSRPSRNEVLGAILDLYAAARHKERCGEKTPQHLLHVPSILSDFPDAKIVCMIRDGRDNVLSLRAMPWWRGSVRAAARLWRRNARLAAEFAAEWPAQFLLLRYEELVREPAAQLVRLMAHLGEAPEPSQLDPAVASSVVLPRSIVWKGQALGAIDAAAADHRRREAGAREVAAIESLVAPELRLLGYPTTARRRLLRLY